jgi:hypothetical protein
MISGLRIKRRANGEIAMIFTRGRAPYGAKRGRWRKRQYFGVRQRCFEIEHVWRMMEADEGPR